MDTATRHSDTSWPVRWLGRFGDVCYGIVHLVAAWLVVRIAFGAPVTGSLLWVLTIGLVIFGAWQILLSTNGFRWVVAGGERTALRVAAAGRTVVALAVASFVLHLLTTGGNGTRRLLRLPGGRLVVLVAGLGVLAACVLSVRSGLGRRFLRDLDTAAMPPRARRRTTVLGTLGFLAKAVAYAVIGVLVCTAAVLVDPRTGGLGRALRALATQPFGAGLLVVVAIGFVAFGGYCLAEARYRLG
jgi:uncharacterized protein DUF1206